MNVEKNWQKAEHELYRVSFLLNDFLKDKNTKRYSPEVRAFVQQLMDFTREAAECAHAKRDFATRMEIWVTEEVDLGMPKFDENGWPIHYE